MLDDKEISELSGVLLVGVLTGAGSIALILSNQSQILVRCNFSVQTRDGEIEVGHGENPMSSVLIFPELNQSIERVYLSEEMDLFLRFSSQSILKIKPERNGLESYVVTTKHGVSPVLLA